MLWLWRICVPVENVPACAPCSACGGATGIWAFAICCLVVCNSEAVRAFEHPTTHTLAAHTQAFGLQTRTVDFCTRTGTVLKCTGQVNCGQVGCTGGHPQSQNNGSLPPSL